MRHAFLNLSALRASRSEPLAQPDRAPDGHLAVSRRQALGLAGLAVVGASPALRAARATVLGAYAVRRTGEYRIAFLLDGQERWVIDARQFAGSPRLEYAEDAGGVRVALLGARYPGTDLPADFRCVVRHGAAGSRLRLTMAFGGFAGSAHFEAWLAGRETLRSTVRFAATRTALGASASLLLRGSAAASYTADWTIELHGSDAAAIDGLGETLIADSALLTLLGRGEPSLFSVPSAKRTAFAQWRGTHSWPLRPAFAQDGHWRLSTTDTSFDLVRLEFGEDASGERHRALVAEAAGTVAFHPHTGLRRADGSTFSLQLSGARYAMAFNPAGDRASLIARFHTETTWLQAGACAVELGDAPTAPIFELHARGGAVTALKCNPAVLRVTAPIAGAVVAPMTQPAGTHLAFVARGLERPNTSHAARIVLSDHPVEAFQRFTLINLRFSILRPDDLLALTFEFINMRLDVSGKGKPPVFVARYPQVRASKRTIGKFIGGPPYLAVHMQGQNIAEEAFFQVEPAIKVPDKYPNPNNPDPNGGVPDPDAGKEGTKKEFPEIAPHTPARTRLADESRLVFAMPPDFTALPLTLEALLDWAKLVPSVPPTALPAGERTTAAIAEPKTTETSLEIPWRLKISPNRRSGWLHSFTPVTHGGRTELWHTRLGVAINVPATPKLPARNFIVDEHYVYETKQTADGPKYTVTTDTYIEGKPADLLASYRTIRAVWSQDYPSGPTRLPDNYPFRTSLTGVDRHDLVELTSFFSRSFFKSRALSARRYVPQPVQVNRLMLSTLGAWVDFRGSWTQGYRLGIALEEWRHRGTQARDHYVRVVYKGYLFPFGHKASLVKITERKFYVQDGRNVAYLFQRMFIIVREPIKQFGSSGLTDSKGNSIDRWMPFKKVQITTITTPDLDPPKTIDSAVSIHDTDDFWPQIAGQDFLFHLIGEDSEGQQTDFTAPLAFISVADSLAFKHDPLTIVRNHYETDNTDAYRYRRTREMNGKKIAFAPSNKPGDTTLHATDITFDAYIPPDNTPNIPDDQPHFYPTVAASTVSIPALEAMLRTGQKPRIKLSDHYLQHELGDPNNVGEVFAEILDARPKVAFGGSNSGGTSTPGTVTPNLEISALSRVLGPVGGDMVANLAKGDVPGPDVSAFLKQFFDSDAKILGAIPLSSIIELPDLKPVFQILSLVQAVESAPDTLNQLIAQAVAKLQQNLAALKGQALTALQRELAPLRAALVAIKGPLNALHNALNALPPLVKDLLGPDIGALIADLGTAIGDLTTLTTDMDTLLADLGAANVGALQGDVNALHTPLTAFPTDLKKVVTDVSNLQGINPLPLLKHAQLPTAIDTTLKWSPHLKDSGPFKAIDNFLNVTANVHIPLDGSSDPSFSIVGTLGKIKLDLFNIIGVSFGGLEFKASSGQKPDVTAGGVVVLFEGPLSFINDLKDIIPSDGFSDPPFVDITANGVEAGFTFDLPSIGVGIFTLENISFGAKVTIPFIGSSPAQVYFNFCTREHPFLLTVSLLGGGGFFGISLGLDGLDMMEAAFEFGAELSLNFGIASGSVSVMAGIYFKMEKSPTDQTILTGFVHIHGEVEALAILSVSIDVELDLTYEKDGKDTKVVGTATLTISVHVLFFSVTVSASVQREFAGSHNDPSFADQVSEQHWNKYLQAFA